MNYFIATACIEYPCTIDLISLGVVSDDDRTLYVVNADCDLSKANAWVSTHVLPHRFKAPQLYWQPKAMMAETVQGFVGEETPAFWGYDCAYDWVAFCWLFGGMMDLPQGWPRFAYDLRQWLDHKGLSHITRPDDRPHQALSDARWIAHTYRRYG